MRLPTVSVLIPCYNAEKYIGETLESVFHQTWPEIEIIVVNDGSTDSSADVVRRLARPNLKLINQGNKGSSAAQNTCIAYASGDFIQYLDADDVINPRKIELQMSRLLQHPNCVASAEWGRFYDTVDRTKIIPEAVWRDLDPMEWYALSLANGLGMMFPALWLIPIRLIRAVGPWNETLTLANDGEYFTRVLLAAEQVLFCPGARCYYRSGVGGSLSGRKSVSALESQYRVTHLCESYVRSREDSERIRRGFALSWQHFAHASYPYCSELAERALIRAQRLHAIRIRPEGGRAFRIAMRLMGWRLARRLQVATGRP
jgi:glycosyltransferase involved in cell wall biosynthesis